jgi:UPF0176 protein
MKNYFILAYYSISEIENVEKELEEEQKFFKNKDILGRIYVSEMGVNGQISCHKDYFDQTKNYLYEKFPDINLKIDPSIEHVFCKMTIKYRKQLVALDRVIDLKNTAEHVSPEIWEKMLDEIDDDTVLIDVRNDYEWKIGHFKKAELIACNTFREFPNYLKELKAKRDPKNTKIMMYCTGGIRCEFFSPLLKEEGFEKIYQLDGGIINYGHKVGSKHWKGKVFVFDDRLATPICDDNLEEISNCNYCQKVCSSYYNCANMDCNELFLSCKECAVINLGCCSKHCLEKGRNRKLDHSKPVKPFRKLSYEEKKAISS